jgi:Tfp pilus assembly protein PilF
VYVAVANYDAANKDIGGALAAMQKAIQLDPNRSDSYLNMALLQAQGQQWDAAESNYKKAIALNPKSTNALVALGNFYQLRGRFPEAERQFRQAIESAPTDPEPRGSLAREERFS